MQTDVVKTLADFIDKAMAQHKYADSSARGLRAALKLFAPYLDSSELTSFDAILDSIDNITIDIYQKQTNDNMTSVTLLVYKRRISKLVRDYKKYGRNPARMAEWNPRRKEPELQTRAAVVNPQVDEPVQQKVVHIRSEGSDDINTCNVLLIGGVRCHLSLPSDLTEIDASIIKRYIDAMVRPSS